MILETEHIVIDVESLQERASAASLTVGIATSYLVKWRFHAGENKLIRINSAIALERDKVVSQMLDRQSLDPNNHGDIIQAAIDDNQIALGNQNIQSLAAKKPDVNLTANVAMEIGAGFGAAMLAALAIHKVSRLIKRPNKPKTLQQFRPSENKSALSSVS